ncbi:MAG: hypothetical protein RR662_07785, partial [Clostridia bacterium]
LLGNTEAIEDLGVNVNVALLETTDAFKQIAEGRSWDKLAFQEQQQVRLLGILEQTSKKYGEEVANNLSLNLAQNAAIFKDVKTEASQFLAVGLQPLMGIIKNIGSSLLILVKALNTLDATTKKNITAFLMCVSVVPVVVLALFLIIKAIEIYKTVMNTAIFTTKLFGAVSIKSILGPAALIAVGIGILAIAFGGLGNAIKNIGNIFKIVGYTMVSAIAFAIGGILSLISILVPSLKGAANSCMAFSRSMYASAQSTLSNSTAVKKTSKSAIDASKTIDKLSNSSNNNADSAKKAAKANKDLKDNLQGFDEINKLQPDTAEAGAGAGDTVSPGIGAIDTGGIGLDTTAFDNFGGMIDNIKNKVNSFIEKVKEIGPAIIAIAAIISALGILNMIKNLGLLNTNIGALALILWGVYEVLNFIKDPLEGINSSFDAIQKACLLVLPLFIGLAIIIGAIPAAIITIALAISVTVANIIKHFDVFKAGWNAIWAEAGRICKGVLDNIGNWIKEKIDWCLYKINEFKTGWDYIMLCLKVGWQTAWNTIVSFFSGIWSGIVSKAKAIGTTFTDVWNSIKATFTNVWNGITSFFSTAFNNIVSKADEIGTTFTNVWNNIKTTFTDVWNWILNAFNTGGEIFSGIKDGIAGVFKTVVNGLIGGINKVVAVPFNAVNGLLNKVRDVNIAGVTPFRGLIKYNPISVPSIPKLATGGVTTGSTIANIGEGRYKEAVIPLENSQQFRDMKQDIADAVAKSGKTGTVQKVEIDILAGGVKIGKKILDLLEQTEDFYGLC